MPVMRGVLRLGSAGLLTPDTQRRAVTASPSPTHGDGDVSKLPDPRDLKHKGNDANGRFSKLYPRRVSETAFRSFEFCERCPRTAFRDAPSVTLL